MRLILCPLKLEQSQLVESLEALGIACNKKQNQGKWYFEIPSLKSILCVGGLGRDKFEQGLKFWCDFFGNIQSVYAVGGAGSLDEKLKIGDILLVSQITSFQSGGSWKLEEASLPLIEGPFEIHKGGMASGDENITTQERSFEIKQQTQALATAWESEGGVKGAIHQTLPYFEIRGITDKAQGNVVEDFKNNLPLALNNVAQVLVAMLKA